MSDEEAARRVEAGRQLRRRRDQLKLTQEELAQLIGVTSRTVSAVERGKNAAQAGHQPSWEEVLHLVPGTLAPAYKTGSRVELLPLPKTGPAANKELLALLTARVAGKAEKFELTALDDRIDYLTARVERVEEHLNEERRTREALERTVTELTRILHDDPAD